MTDSFGSHFRTWKNQYIDLVESKTDKIISLVTEHPTPAHCESLKKLIAPFSTVFCEIGPGSGGHLIELAARNPTAAYVGFELRFKRAFKTVQKAEKRGIKNLFVVRANALTMKEFFAPASLAGVYVNFPDPWSKKHWKKNRILNPSFLEVLQELLAVDGFLSYKTDHLEYFEETLETVGKMPRFSIRKLTKDLYASEFVEANIPTEFENLFKSQGLKINFFEAVKLGN
ncbi:MAG: tRNA (guanosine(46)-N7)-methyltransferase TrmB [Deltaproteobacteria bacterium]|nr:tRNA (guanosine(46)-N7)-methyltransferase TrmB [Deltaproteobacteria bacterium]